MREAIATALVKTAHIRLIVLPIRYRRSPTAPISATGERKRQVLSLIIQLRQPSPYQCKTDCSPRLSHLSTTPAQSKKPTGHCAGSASLCVTNAHLGGVMTNGQRQESSRPSLLG
jgi:hypothetical protein